MRRGPLYAVLASLSFVAMMAFGKVAQARSSITPLEIVFWRGFVALPVIFLMARGVPRGIVNKKIFALRAVFGTTTVLLLMLAVSRLAVAEVSLLDKIQPMAIAVLAGLLLGKDERPAPRIWAFLIVGLIGCALILGPDLKLGSFWGLFALGAALSAACAQICLRILSRTDRASSVSFYFFVCSIPLALVAHLLVYHALPALPSPTILPHILGFGVTAATGQVLLTKAYGEDRAAVVAAAGYTGPLWAVILDAIVFSSYPEPLDIVGGLLIVGPGLLLLFDRTPPTPRAGIEA